MASKKAKGDQALERTEYQSGTLTLASARKGKGSLKLEAVPKLRGAEVGLSVDPSDLKVMGQIGDVLGASGFSGPR